MRESERQGQTLADRDRQTDRQRRKTSYYNFSQPFIKIYARPFQYNHTKFLTKLLFVSITNNSTGRRLPAQKQPQTGVLLHTHSALPGRPGPQRSVFSPHLRVRQFEHERLGAQHHGALSRAEVSLDHPDRTASRKSGPQSAALASARLP